MCDCGTGASGVVTCGSFGTVISDGKPRTAEDIAQLFEDHVDNKVFVEMDINGDCDLTVAEIETYAQRKQAHYRSSGHDLGGTVVVDGVITSELDVLFHDIGLHTGKGNVNMKGWGTYQIPRADFEKIWNTANSVDRCPNLHVVAPLDETGATPLPEKTAPAKQGRHTQQASIKSAAKPSVADLVKQGEGLGLDMSGVTDKPATPATEHAAPDPIVVVQPDEIAAPAAAVSTTPKPISGIPQMMLTCGKPTRLGEIVARGARIRTTDPTYAGYSASYDYSAIGRGGVVIDDNLKPGFDRSVLERIADLEVQLGQPDLPRADKEKLSIEQARLVDQTPTLQPGVFFIVGLKK